MHILNKQIQAHFDENMKQHNLYRVDLPGRDVWDLYLNSFTTKTNPIFRDPESSSHNCNHCKNFIRRYGNIVAIDSEYNLITLFDVVPEEPEYNRSLEKMAKAIRKSKISDVFFETYSELQSLPYQAIKKTQPVFRLGFENNHKQYTAEEAETFGVVKVGEIRTFNHFFLDIPKKFVDQSGKSVESIMGTYRDAAEVFLRGMETISLDTLKLVRDLINQGSLLNGDSHLHKIEAMIPLKEEYDDLPKKSRNAWGWAKAHGFQFAKFRNELIGVLCKELSEGEDLNKACLNWNKRVDPANYMKATAPITETQIKEAKKFAEDKGYEESFDRRYANIDDIKASEILHISAGDGKIKKASIFDGVKSSKKSSHSRNEFEGVEEISIDKFMKKVLPDAKSLEVYLENRMDGNMMTLTTSTDDESKPIFKYSNNYSQTFNGNLAGKSEIKEAVLSQGGKSGVLRFSIMWAEGTDDSDLDAHCVEPNGNRIYYSIKVSTKTGGNLDIDITQPQGHKRSGKKVVENITYPSIARMSDGVYKFMVHQFSARNSQGFTAEIEFDGEIYSYTYTKPLRGKSYVQVAEVTLKNGELSIVHKLPEQNASKELYGLETKQFHKVNLLCLSPNHWSNNSIGDKYYLFLLDKCKVPTSIRSFHNVDLLPELQKHRRVLEVLGATNMIEPSNDKQLSGIGFNSTVRDNLLVKVQGSHKRMLRITF